jgi:DNA-binding SARP family transcriptional activator/tetratricopeptide (TPR) repeat protein/TolB-like protein
VVIMIELRTLGLLELRGADGDELRPVLRQPKRLALLVYLAANTPLRYHRRDALLGMFWPELDAEHARAALRRALYFLRQSMGDDLIVSRGDDEVGIAPDEIQCDVIALDRACSEGRYADALALYHGPLLQGFYVSDSPEFERWLDETRASVHRRATSAAAALTDAAEAAGDSASAADWAHRAAALEPYDERIHRRLVEQLDRTGDRAGALRAHDEFARRLRKDYELDPSAETTALIASLREPGLDARSPVFQSHRPAATDTQPPNPGVRPVGIALAQPPNVEPRVIAIFPFTVRGNRELAYFSDGIVDLLSTTLDGAGDYRTVDPRALLGYLAREESATLDPARAETIAARFGAGRFVMGSLVEAGGRIKIQAQLYGGDGRAIGAADVAGTSESGLFEMVDGVTRQLLAAMSDGPALRLSRLAAATTHSVVALKAYLRGESEFRAGAFHVAVEMFEAATAEDASFALAYYRLAAAAAAVFNLELAHGANEHALRHRARLTGHDRLLLDAQRAWLAGDADEAERLYEEIVRTYPDDLEAWFLLGDALFHHNPLRGRSTAEARRAFESALRYDPDHVSSLVHLARIAAIEGRREDLRELVAHVLRLSPTGDRAISMRALRAFSSGNEIEKARVVTLLARSRAMTVGIAFTDVVLYARDYAGARRLSRFFVKLTRAPEENALSRFVLAHLELAFGRSSVAFGELRAAAAHEPAWALEFTGLFAIVPFIALPFAELTRIRDDLLAAADEPVAPHRNRALAVHNGVHGIAQRYLAAMLDVRLGREAEAERVAATMCAEGESAAFCSGLAASIRSSIAAHAGDHARALRLLESAQTPVWYQDSISTPLRARVHDRYSRGELLCELGRNDEALGWYRALGESSPYELPFIGAAAVRQGEILALRGDSVSARQQFARAAALWKHADRGLSEIRDRARAAMEHDLSAASVDD